MMSIKSTSLVVIALSALSAFTQAQAVGPRTRAAVRPTSQTEPAATKPAKADIASASASCFATFNTALPNFCVTENGNIENFIYPAGYSQIYTDGYGVCDFTGSSNVSYYDVGANDSGNWLSSIVTEPGGANTFPLTIKRTTSDGIWTITQVFSRSTTDAYVKVLITLKNNSAVQRIAQMTRYVDIDADGVSYATSNYFDGSADSGWGYNSAGATYPNHGLTIHSSHSIHNYFGYNTPWGNYDPCNFTSNSLTAPTYGDEAVMYTWAPNGDFTVGPGKSITVTLEYRPM